MASSAGGAGQSQENIRVVARLRPLNAAEISRGETYAVTQGLDGCSVKVVGKVAESKRQVATSYEFNECIEPGIPQAEAFERTGIHDLLKSVLNGFAATCFGYGQTGSGKTFSIVGADDVQDTLDKRSSEGDGLLSRSVKYMFNEMKKRGAEYSYTVHVSFLEIYNEQVYDMLTTSSSRPALQVKWDPTKGFHVPDCLSVECGNKNDVMRTFCQGFRRTRVGSHAMNARSNRSHSLFTISFRRESLSQSGDVCFGKLTVVDLAGSERQDQTGASAEMLRESGQINKSLFTLGKVISVLSDSKANNNKSVHVPFRDSKLTRLLKDSIGGNCKTLIIVCMSCSTGSLGETLRSLEFGSRAKNIRNKPVVILDPKESLIRDLRNEIRRLRYQLRTQNEELQSVVQVAASGSDPYASFHESFVAGAGAGAGAGGGEVARSVSWRP